jgi:ribulose-phosphate 3-epimerase
MNATDLVADLRASGPHLSIGILTADLLHLGDELALLEQVGARIVHTDVGDGVFSPMFTVGAPFVKAQRTTLLKDAHLMIEDPIDKVQAFVDAGADIITFHVESTRHPHRVLQALGQATNANEPERGIVRGVALNPGTPLQAVEPLLTEVEYVLLLAVNPGWGGQAFIPSTEERLSQLRAMCVAAGCERILIGIDGGITRSNLSRVAALGADIVVRHRLNLTGDRQLGLALQRIAITQVRLLSEGRAHFEHRLAAGDTQTELS